MPDGLEDKVFEFIRLHGIFAGDGGILIAVSGGADSIALLHVLATLRTDLVCAHVNHQLRGQAADEDERFVVEQATLLNLPVVARTVDVRSHAKAHKLSVETAARQLRLAALAEIAREHGCSWIATGHHKNDNAETVLHRLRRGTGFRGLAGMRPVRPAGEELSLARPLLCVTRDEILRHLHERGLSWREDHTNADIVHTRNFIRHRLLPLLQQEAHGSLVEELSQLAAAAARLSERVRRQVDRAWTANVQAEADEIRIEASQLASLPEWIAVELIRRGLASLGCGERNLIEGHYQSVLKVARQQLEAERTSLPNGFIASLESDQLVLRHGVRGSRLDALDAPFVLDIPGTTAFADREIDARILPRCEIDMARVTSDKGPFCEYLDWDRIEPPVVVRPRRPGDRFQPLGLEAEKKVGKLLTAARIPRRSRERTIIFADRQRILWVCPVRIAESAKITDETRQVLRLTVHNA